MLAKTRAPDSPLNQQQEIKTAAVTLASLVKRYDFDSACIRGTEIPLLYIYQGRVPRPQKT